MTQRITTPDARAPAREFAKGWPSMTDAAGFADKMNSMPRFVVSTTLDTAEWTNTTLIRDNVAEGLVQATPVGADGVVILTYELAWDGK